MINKLLSLPFVISPLLITSLFLDPTIHVKRFSVFFLFTIILIIFFLFKVPSNKLPKRISHIYYFLSVYILYLLFSSYYVSTNLNESLFGIFYLAGWFLIYIIFIRYLNKDSFKFIIYTTAIIGSILSLLIYNDIFQIINLNIPTYGKLSATFGYKNFFAQYLCFVIPACICSIFIIENKKCKILMFLCTLLTSGAMVFTRCRAAWLGIFVALIIFIIINRKLIINSLFELCRNKVLLLSSSIFLIVFLFLILLPVNIESGIWIGNKSSFKNTLLSIKNINDSSFWGNRIDMHKASYFMFRDHPLIGTGIGNWKTLYPGYSSNESYVDYFRNKIVLRPHNDTLLMLVETGIIGILLLLLLLLYHIRILIRNIKKYKPGNDYFIMMFCALSLIAISVESLFDFPIERTIPNLYFWLILGYIFISSTQNKSRENNLFNKLSYIVLFTIITCIVFIDIKSQFHIQKQFNSTKYMNIDELNKDSKSYWYSLRNIDYLANPVAYHIGLRYNNLDHKDIALTWFDKSLRLSPYHFESLNNKMLLLLKKNKFDEAYEIMLDIKQYYPKLNMPRIKMAKYCIRAKEYNYANEILSSFDNNLDNKISEDINNLKKMIPQ